ATPEVTAPLRPFPNNRRTDPTDRKTDEPNNRSLRGLESQLVPGNRSGEAMKTADVKNQTQDTTTECQSSGAPRTLERLLSAGAHVREQAAHHPAPRASPARAERAAARRGRRRLRELHEEGAAHAFS